MCRCRSSAGHEKKLHIAKANHLYPKWYVATIGDFFSDRSFRKWSASVLVNASGTNTIPAGLLLNI